MAGGVSGLHEITPEVAQLAHHHKADAEAKIGHSFAHFTPVGYTQQVRSNKTIFLSLVVFIFHHAAPNRAHFVAGSFGVCRHKEPPVLGSTAPSARIYAGPS